jgi:hypothetical protein
MMGEVLGTQKEDDRGPLSIQYSILFGLAGFLSKKFWAVSWLIVSCFNV